MLFLAEKKKTEHNLCNNKLVVPLKAFVLAILAHRVWLSPVGYRLRSLAPTLTLFVEFPDDTSNSVLVHL
jgi:hypothetical protein